MATAYRDYYAALGVGKKATQKEIRSAFRKLARQYHPDVNTEPSALERFKEINEANEVLSDPAKRRTYDDVGPQWEQYQQWDRAGRPGGGNPFAGGADPFAGAHRASAGASRPAAHNASAAGYTTMSPDDVESLFGQGQPFSDFFNDLFGGAGGGAAPRGARRGAPSSRGADVEAEVTITLAEAHAGTDRTVEMMGGGSRRRIEVRIPAGVVDGARVRVAGQGGRGQGGGSNGNLFIRVHIASHPNFAREGHDVRTRVDVPLYVALLGGQVEVPTPKGTRVTLGIPAGTQNGAKLRLRGQGMPKLRGEGNGDLLAEVHVRLPLPLDERGRAAAEQFKPGN